MYYANINKALRESKRIGGDWYFVENNWIQKISKEWNVSVAKVAALTSILSINRGWASNKKEVVKYLKGEWKGMRMVKTKLDRLEKCNMDDDCIMEILNGEKIKAFYLNLKYPYRTDVVTIDRHMLRVAGYLKKPTSKIIKEIAASYIKVAKDNNIHPNSLQAMLWVDQINKK